MTFKRARTSAQIDERRREILSACATLFDQGDIDDVHFKAIGQMTSFARSTIYKYYSSKEEILLDLLIQEVKKWVADVESFTQANDALSREGFCQALTQTYAGNFRMLRLLAHQNLSLEKNSSLEKIVEFKKELYSETASFVESIQKFFPQADQRAVSTFIHSSSCFIVGLYPTAHSTQKQIEATLASGNEYVPVDFSGTCYRVLMLLTADLV